VNAYTVSLTLTVWANDAAEAWGEFVQAVRHGQYIDESVEIKREPDADTEERLDSIE